CAGEQIKWRTRGFKEAREKIAKKLFRFAKEKEFMENNMYREN
ncbi:TetR family transcriptional regulator, partial [Listeria monocytogenes]